jgi:hypothetical protein
MAITKTALDAIRNDSDLRAKLMLVDSKSEYTIKRWIEDNDSKLTMPMYTSVIAEHTKMKLTEILENIKALA